jgi:hypothetical protein
MTDLMCFKASDSHGEVGVKVADISQLLGETAACDIR